MELPPRISTAMAPLFEALPLDLAMYQLIVEEDPSNAVAAQVGAVLADPALLDAKLQTAVWLYVDDLDRSHSISRGIEDITDSFWHGIMHRREGGFPNSHYWFDKVGVHSAFVLVGDYDPHEFVAAVETRHYTKPENLIATKRREWEGLFRWCAESAEGAA